MKKEVSNGAASNAPAATPKKAAGKVFFAESTVASGGIIISGKYVAKLWE